MRGHRRKYYSEGFEHIFQHSIGYRVIFYSLEDRLVFFTILSALAWKYGIVIIALALMYNHFHMLIQAPSKRVMSLFIGTVTSTYAKAFNRDSGRKGKLFEKAFGNSSKKAEKAIRSSIAYLFNNSVEKKLFARAEHDRWNLLAYLDSDHPFSPPLILSTASTQLRNAIKEVNQHVKDHAYLNYATIRRLYRKLSFTEKEQLTDYILSRFLPIDKELLVSFYKDYDSMVMAINSNTGSEYDIKEEYRAESDQAYTEMLEVVARSTFAENPHTIIREPLERKKYIASQLKQLTTAKYYQIARMLHLE